MRNRLAVLFGAVSLVVVMVLTASVSVAAASDHQRDLGAQVVTSFDGLNHYWDRTLTGVSNEPPEQGLCAGGGFVVESVTSLIAVYDTTGHLVKGPTTLNSFFGYAPVLTPPTPVQPASFGPQVTDPSCYYDAATQRFFQVVITVEVTPANGHPTGVNHVDIAVSQTSDPTGAWSVHKLYPQADCAAPGNPSACLGDFPHIGADAHGIYITTNDYNFFARPPVYRSASVYAFSKQALETDTAGAVATRIDTAGMVNGTQAGFTLWPAQSPDADSFRSGDLETARGGVEFFLSSNAADEVNGSHSQTSSDLVVWALSNTESLDSDQPSLHLSNTVLTVEPYAFPPRAQQKAGSTPLADCLNDTTLPFRPGMTGCWRRVVPVEPAHNWSEGQAIDTGDTRMQQVMFAGGMVFGALDTAVTVGDSTTAGLEWFAVRPHVTAGGDVHAEVVNSGYVAQAGRFLTAPAIAVDDHGSGAIAFSLMGPDDYPGAAYVPFDVKAGTGDIQLAAAGVGPDDGYTNYAAAFMAPNRARWGDYGAAAVDGSHVWFASEYIAQTCTYADWVGTSMSTFGLCGNTRRGAANWATRVTEVSIGG